MIEVTPLTPEAPFQSLYGRFSGEAHTRYGWDLPPVPLAMVCAHLSAGELRGYLIQDGPGGEPIGFFLYRQEAHGALEVNVCYLRPDAEFTKALAEAVWRRFLHDAMAQPDWTVISYALLGEQRQWVRVLPWYGCQLVGQTIIRLNTRDPLAKQIALQQSLPAPPAGFTLRHWQPSDTRAVVPLLASAFQDAPDGLWDPRFRSDAGIAELVNELTQHAYGEHQARWTAVLTDPTQRPVGVCFLLTMDTHRLNIPLIAVDPAHQQQGFGALVMRRALQSAMVGHPRLQEINATTDTDRGQTLRLYRRFGFVESEPYAHAVLTRSRLAQTQGARVWDEAGKPPLNIPRTESLPNRQTPCSSAS